MRTLRKVGLACGWAGVIGGGLLAAIGLATSDPDMVLQGLGFVVYNQVLVLLYERYWRV